MCLGDLRQLTNTEYGRIRREKEKEGGTKKKKAGEMRKVGKKRKRKGRGREGKRMRLRPRENVMGKHNEAWSTSVPK